MLIGTIMIYKYIIKLLIEEANIRFKKKNVNLYKLISIVFLISKV